ncbi:MAG: hypothetical protein RLZZ399_2703 [Verrucomicrobiota bacterium]|jgi:hypothetical protein
MHNAALLTLQLVFTGVLIALLLGGVWILKNHQRHFGVDPDIPSENSGSRAYNKLQVIVVWLHAILLAGGFVLLLH